MDYQEKYVMENWKDQCRIKLARSLRTTEKKVQKIYHKLREQGLLPTAKEMQRYRMKAKASQSEARNMRLEFIKDNWLYMNQTELARAIGVGRETVGKMQKELAERGEIPPGNEMQAIKSKSGYKEKRDAQRRERRELLYRAWVPVKWINHQLKWLGA